VALSTFRWYMDPADLISKGALEKVSELTELRVQMAATCKNVRKGLNCLADRKPIMPVASVVRARLVDSMRSRALKMLAQREVLRTV